METKKEKLSFEEITDNMLAFSLGMTGVETQCGVKIQISREILNYAGERKLRSEKVLPVIMELVTDYRGSKCGIVLDLEEGETKYKVALWDNNCAISLKEESEALMNLMKTK